MCASLAPPEHFKPLFKKKASTALVCKNILVNGRRTSVRLDPIMWGGLSEICRRQGTTIHVVCTAISQNRPPNMSLSNAIRVFILSYFRAAATEEGHAQAGHGHQVEHEPFHRLVKDTLS